MLDKPYSDWFPPLTDYKHIKKSVNRYMKDNPDNKEVLILKTELAYDIGEEPIYLSEYGESYINDIRNIRENKILTIFYIKYIK